METVVGIFSERNSAEVAMEHLRLAGFDQQNIVLLTPEIADQKLRQVPTDEAEQPGMGKVIGGVAGGAAGLAGGALVASLVLPGIGPILAIGIGAATFGVGGAVVGGAAGDSLENLLSRGLPKDEIFLYEDALRQGRTLVIALAENEDWINRSRVIMERDGAESLDAARKEWWIGLRDTEKAEYDSSNGSFDGAEQIYRRGFEAALEPQCRGKSLQDARGLLHERDRALCDQEPFRRGYERGQKYYAEHPRNENNQRD